MDTNALKTPATLPFAAWQSLSPEAATREVQARIAALPENFRRAALAWIRPEAELQRALTNSAKNQNILHGVPYLLKDLFDFRGAPTQAGATFLDKARGMPTTDSALVTQLEKLGAACVGKTHLVEFAAGLFGDNAHYGDCPHPLYPDRLSGGSSSGSASLVGAGVAPFAIGTDTGGSVRVPAAFCGVYGFRLSPRDAFISDAVALSPTLDTAGWFTNCATDMLTVNSALVGPSKNKTNPRGAHMPTKAFAIAFDEITASAYDRAAAKLSNPIDADALAELQRSWQNAIDAYTVIALSDANKVHRRWLEPYRAHYEPSIWQRFTDGGKYTPVQIEHAHATQETIRKAFRDFFAWHDYLILPATSFPALRKSECTPEARRSLLTLTAPASLAGLPVLTIPVPIGGGLTTGLQIILPHTDSAAVPALLNTQ